MDPTPSFPSGTTRCGVRWHSQSPWLSCVKAKTKTSGTLDYMLSEDWDLLVFNTFLEAFQNSFKKNLFYVGSNIQTILYRLLFFFLFQLVFA